MALSSAALSTDLQNDLKAQFTFQDNVILQKFCDAVALAVVTRIKADAQVVVASVSGVTAGGGVSGPGTGTIT